MNNKLYMEQLQNLQEITLWGNSLYDYAKSLGIFILLLLALKIFQAIIVARLRKIAEKTKTDLDDVLISIVSGIKPPAYLIIGLYIALNMLSISSFGMTIAKFIFMAVIIFEVIRAIEKFVDYWVKRYVQAGKKKDKANRSMISAIRIIIRLTLWSVGLLLLISNMGFNVSSLVASLGIGGIAVALAVQNILGDLFSSFSIYIDQPLEVGDYVELGEHSGTVTHIGMKTTRLKSLRGEEIVISNRELTSARISNFKKLKRRRIHMVVGIEYGTSAGKLEKLPKLVEAIITSIDNLEFERCYFKEYAASSLDFEISYYVNSDSFQEATEVRQAVNMEIYKTFEQEGIPFAFPTQTIHVKK